MTAAATVVGVFAGRDARAFMNDWSRAADRWWHRASSGLASLVWAQALGWGLGRQVAALAIGCTFGGGRWSPDMDQYKFWSRVESWPIVQWISRRTGSPLRHHGITHSVPIAATVTAVAALWAAFFGGTWVAAFVPLQWVHHDLGDVGIGRGGEEVDCGPSWGLWRRNWGLGIFKSGGPTCRALTVACWLAIFWLLWRAAA